MIAGVGVDMVSIARIADIVGSERRQRFSERVLTPGERKTWESKGHEPAWLAKRWAAKEAVAKALKTGIGQVLSFQDIEIVNLPGGAPSVEMSHRARTLLDELGIQSLELSLSDEREYALAFAVALRRP
jgi:holo-[acyl-carrier protein] synthase